MPTNSVRRKGIKSPIAGGVNRHPAMANGKRLQPACHR